MEMEPTLDYILSERQRLWDLVEYSCPQFLFKERYRRRNQYLANHVVALNDAATVKLRAGDFGTFLQEFNSQQTQDEDLNENKLGIYKCIYKDYTPKDLERLNDNNNFTEYALALLEMSVLYAEEINFQYLYSLLETFRLTNLNVSS